MLITSTCESVKIMRMLNNACLCDVHDVDFFPLQAKVEMDRMNASVGQKVPLHEGIAVDSRSVLGERLHP